MDFPNTRYDGKKPTMAGSYCILKVGGKVMGRTQRYTIDEDYGLQPVDEIGEYGPMEYVPARYTVRMGLAHLAILGEPLEKMEDEFGRPIYPTRDEIFRAGITQIEVYTKPSVTGAAKLVTKVLGARCATKGLDLGAASLLIRNTSWVGYKTHPGEV
jgi:hypothetical protein